MVSGFYTTQLQAGLGLVDETQLLLSLCEEGTTSAGLLAKALASGYFPHVTARRLRNIVTECFATRYLQPTDVALRLKPLAGAMGRPEFNQLLLIHTARANTVLADFIRDVYWPRYGAGRDALTLDDAKAFVLSAVREGRTQKNWANSTVQRMASYLLGCCMDYGLLGGSARGPRRIQPLRVSTAVAAYLAHDLHFQGLGDNQIVCHEDWQLLGMQPQDVREQLKRLSLQGLLILQAAADVIHIGWHHNTMGELIDVLTRP